MRALVAVVGLVSTLAGLLILEEGGEAAWPGINGRILYSQSSSGIWSTEPDGSDRLQLTTVEDFAPSASPDGSRIAFERSLHVWVMDTDGSDEQMIAEGENPTWSQDGERILFTRNGLVMEMDADGSNEETKTTDSGVVDAYPVYQPGGNLIALLRRHQPTTATGVFNQTPDIYLMSPDGSVQPVTQTTDYFEGPPDWSPDGTHLVFRGYSGHIYTWQLGSSDPPEVILPYGDVLLGPSWSPDGEKIVFSRGEPMAFRGLTADPQGTAPQSLQLWIMDADGSNPQPMPGAATMTFESSPDWSVPFSPPALQLTQGDNDCDGDSDAVDALAGLQKVAGLEPNQQPDCLELGAAVPAGGEPQLFGDIDCDGDVDAVDALQILRNVAGLPVNQEEGCTPIGQPL